MAAIEGARPAGVEASHFATKWAARYTRGLPTEVRDRRIAEIASDVHDHAQAAEMRGGRTTGLEIGWRAVRGIPADVSWRRQERRAMSGATREIEEPTPLRKAWAVVTQTWFAPIAVLLGVFDLLASIAVVADDESKMPGQVIGPIVMTLLALSLFTGLWLRWRTDRSVDARGSSAEATSRPAIRHALFAAALVLTFALLTVGIAHGTTTAYLIVGLVVALVVVIGGAALVRTFRSTELSAKAGFADVLIVVGTLPALALFWMIIPPLLALAVIGGVLGTSPRLRVA